MLKRTLTLLGIVIVLAITALFSSYGFGWRAQSVTDVTKVETITLKKTLIQGSPWFLQINFSGEIQGTAEISLMHGPDKPYRTMKLSGPVNFEWGSEWYSDTADIRYEPKSVTGGKLRLEYWFTDPGVFTLDSLLSEASRCARPNTRKNASRKPTIATNRPAQSREGDPAKPKTRLVQNLEAGKKQTLVTFGTSLTAVGAWVDQLRAVLDQQFPGQATVINGAQGGANSDWGREKLDEKVLTHKPDTVLIEFSVNDAVAKRKTSVDHARGNLENMIERILATNPDCEIILQVMNPPVGHTKTERPDIAAYDKMYRDVAAARGFRLIDHGSAWQELLKSDPRTFLLCSPDTIHPLRSGSLKVSTPVVVAELGLAPGDPSASTEAHCDKYIRHLMDKGQDRTVSRTEFDAFWIEQFKLNDTDSNGNITTAELHSPELHAALDANRDGNLDQPEYVAFFAPLFENNAPETSSPTKR